jgi:hypothetical protein
MLLPVGAASVGAAIVGHVARSILYIVGTRTASLSYVTSRVVSGARVLRTIDCMSHRHVAWACRSLAGGREGPWFAGVLVWQSERKLHWEHTVSHDLAKLASLAHHCCCLQHLSRCWSCSTYPLCSFRLLRTCSFMEPVSPQLRTTHGVLDWGPDRRLGERVLGQVLIRKKGRSTT